MGVLGVRGPMFGGRWIKTYIKISSLKSLIVISLLLEEKEVL
jgi:hypothetical protein